MASLYDARDLIKLECSYVVYREDVAVDEICGTAFMLWTGLREFLDVYYPGWTKVEYSIIEFGVTRDTIYAEHQKA